MSSSIDRAVSDVLAILGASSPVDVRIHESHVIRPAYAFDAMLSSAPDHVLPIDEATASMLIARGARRA